MRVEPCCQALLAELLPALDPERSGVCLDVGVGTFAFYCQLFAELGYLTIAIEPLPVKKLLQLTNHPNLTLLPQCLSDHDGEQTLYVGTFAGLFNSNFSSLSPQWFGASAKAKQVPTQTLKTLITQQQITTLTCLKLDIEGWEWQIIQQLSDLSPSLLPEVVMFEYGGGVNRRQGKKGWSTEFFTQTLQCLETLQQCGYGAGILLDFAPDSQEKLFDLQTLETRELDCLFSPESVYGNILVFRTFQPNPKTIQTICQPFYRVTWLERLVNALVSR